MDIKVLASSSSGNCYRISDGKTSLLLEGGIQIKRIKEGLDFKLNDIAACLLTHEHKDHSKAVNDIAKAGIDVYMSAGTKSTLSITGHRIKLVKPLQQFNIGTFQVLPFDIKHDAEEPMGYLIYSKLTHEKLLFATDTYYVKYRFSGLTHIMVECNYSADILYSNVEANLVPTVLKNRLLESHFSLKNVLEFLRANDLSQVKAIMLLHLSSGNSDSKLMKESVQKLTGKQVYIADKGMEVLL